MRENENLDNHVTILSIDGDAAHGVIPLVFLQSLEKYLQKHEDEDKEKEIEEKRKQIAETKNEKDKEKLNNEIEEIDKKKKKKKVRIADYFDLIAGAGIGSFIAAMLTKPEPSDGNQIMEALKEICKVTFLDDREKNRIKLCYENMIGSIITFASMFWIRSDHDLYKVFERYWDRSYLEDKKPIEAFKRKLLDHGLGKIQLHQTITHLIAPAFHFDSVRPMVFSSYTQKKETEVEGKLKGKKDVSLMDMVLCSTATPAVFPFYEMEGNKNYKGLSGRFAGGSIMANNPSMLALQEGARIFGSEPKFKNYQVLSLGTVRPHVPRVLLPVKLQSVFKRFLNIVNIQKALLYLVNWRYFMAYCIKCTYSLLNDITEFYLARLFPTNTHHQHFSSNYLRLQHQLKDGKGAPSILNGSRKAIEKLSEGGEKTLKENVKVINPNTGEYVEHEFTNEKALEEFAEKLYKIRQMKLQKQKSRAS